MEKIMNKTANTIPHIILSRKLFYLKKIKKNINDKEAKKKENVIVSDTESKYFV